MDEYGRNPGQPGYQDEGRRSFEQVRIDEGKKEWARRRLGKSLARVVDQMREDTVSDRMMNRFLQEQGLLPGQPDEANSG
jgi:hypothetical protein